MPVSHGQHRAALAAKLDQGLGRHAEKLIDNHADGVMDFPAGP
jgi:hypothetical protein